MNVYTSRTCCHIRKWWCRALFLYLEVGTCKCTMHALLCMQHPAALGKWSLNQGSSRPNFQILVVIGGGQWSGYWWEFVGRDVPTVKFVSLEQHECFLTVPALDSCQVEYHRSCLIALDLHPFCLKRALAIFFRAPKDDLSEAWTGHAQKRSMT